MAESGTVTATALGRVLLCAVLLGGCSSARRSVEPGETDRGRPSIRVQALYRQIRGVLRELAAEPSAKKRAALAREAVELGRRCDRRAPGDPRCDYGLALALGVQAREAPSTAFDSLPVIVELLQRAAAADPFLDHAGPERVLALLLVRAPGWPAGPGDPETGLETARRATERVPGYAPNWLVLAEAAGAMGEIDERRRAAEKARTLADEAAGAGEEDAAGWKREAEVLLER